MILLNPNGAEVYHLGWTPVTAERGQHLSVGFQRSQGHALGYGRSRGNSGRHHRTPRGLTDSIDWILTQCPIFTKNSATSTSISSINFCGAGSLRECACSMRAAV